MPNYRSRFYCSAKLFLGATSAVQKSKVIKIFNLRYKEHNCYMLHFCDSVVFASEDPEVSLSNQMHSFYPRLKFWIKQAAVLTTLAMTVIQFFLR